MTGFGLVVSFYFIFDIPLFDCIISIRLSDYPLVLLSMNAIYGFCLFDSLPRPETGSTADNPIISCIGIIIT
jgi:hypothetical protein